jgi:hypothetical protein
VVKHAIDGLKVLFGFIVQLLGLLLELLESALGIDVDGVLGVLAEVELCFECLRRLRMVMPVSQLPGNGRVPSHQACLEGLRRLRGRVKLTRTTLLEKPLKLMMRYEMFSKEY